MGAQATATRTDGGGDAPGVSFEHLPERWDPSLAKPRLPIGAAVVAVVIGLLGFLLVVGAMLVLLSSSIGALVPPSLDIFSGISVLDALVLIILGGALLSIATALWRQETWALWTTIVLVFAMTTYLFFTGFITILFLLAVALLVDLLTVRRYFY